MRRRVREADAADAPPAELLRFIGTTNRDKLAWLAARQHWWDTTQDPDSPFDLDWVIDGHDQTGDMHWCGSIGAPCNDPDCLCTVWPEYLNQTAPAPLSGGGRHPLPTSTGPLPCPMTN